MRLSLVVSLYLLTAAASVAADASSTASVDYAKQIKPILVARCYACHGALKQEGGLRLDTAESIKRGGDTGPAVLSGKSAESVLIARVSNPDLDSRMPPESEGTPLKPAEQALLKAWIDQGAIAPEGEKPEVDPRDHWAFRAPERPPVPQVKEQAWVANSIDAFIAAQLEQRGLAHQPPADKRLLLRRVYLDLVGLPPTAEQLNKFAAADSATAYERVVEELLASPQYSERWGRHWMDVWRYSDWWGLGVEVRNSQKHIWHWRDWILESLTKDVGYDEMLRQMLAADELYPEDLDRLRATGFLARHYFKFNRNTWLNDTIEHTSKAFLGLTLNCTKCHDHKYDPLSQRDYYRMRAFFEPYQIRTDQVPGESDYEKDGIPRVFDCNLTAPTYRFLRGDEAQPIKDEPITPGLPALLMFDELDIQPITLPPSAQQPGLRSFVLGNFLKGAEKKVADAKTALVAAQKALADAEAAAAKAAELKAADEKAAAEKSPEQKATSDAELLETANEKEAKNRKDAKDAKKDNTKKDQEKTDDDQKEKGEPAKPEPPKVLTPDPVKVARFGVTAAELAVVLAESQLPSLKARAAADTAKAAGAADLGKLAREAAKQEQAVTVAKARHDAVLSEIDLAKVTAADKLADAEKKVAAARTAIETAEKAMHDDKARYAPLTGALKTLESNQEGSSSQLAPFPKESTGRRTALARWLTDRRNPLTARVAVNHIWSRHFGAPLVPTMFDFGRNGLPPTHPQLLDWLAVELMDHNWSMRHLHRLMVMSNAYRMSSSAAGADAAVAADSENRNLWRMNSTRMEAQLVRDTLLHLSGQLDPAMGGPSLDPVKQELVPRRSLYFVHSHNDHHRFLSMFDDASVQECYRREQSIVPQQALALSNSQQALDAAGRIAARLEQSGRASSDEDFIRQAFLLVLAAEPSPAELAACQAAIAEWQSLDASAAPGVKKQTARTNLVLALLNHNDFVTIR